MPERLDFATAVCLPHDTAARMRQLDQLHASRAGFSFDCEAESQPASVLAETGEHPESD